MTPCSSSSSMTARFRSTVFHRRMKSFSDAYSDWICFREKSRYVGDQIPVCSDVLNPFGEDANGHAADVDLSLATFAFTFILVSVIGVIRIGRNGRVAFIGLINDNRLSVEVWIAEELSRFLEVHDREEKFVVLRWL
jgi:hypothetical protein